MQVFGTFSEVAGLPSKVGGAYKVPDVTMKRGVVESSSLSEWISAARTNGPAAARDVQVTQRGEGNATVAVWRLVNATTKSFNGSAPGSRGGDLALEELVLSAQQIEKT